MASQRQVLVLSGPNLNLLGSREPGIYGSSTLESIVNKAKNEADSLNLSVEHRQSNQASELVAWIQGSRHDAIVINPGAFTHYAWSIHDALRAFTGKIVEIHLSEPLRRESWRHQSVVAPVAHGTISGFGERGYVLAMHAVAQLLAD